MLRDARKSSRAIPGSPEGNMDNNCGTVAQWAVSSETHLVSTESVHEFAIVSYRKRHGHELGTSPRQVLRLGALDSTSQVAHTIAPALHATLRRCLLNAPTMVMSGLL